MLMRICEKCGQRTAAGAPCACTKARHKEYDGTRRSKGRAAFYHGRAWRALAAACRMRDGGIDQYAYHAHKQIRCGALCHHIVEVAEDESKALDLDNLIFVSEKSHAEIHSAYSKSPNERANMQKTLMEIVAQRRPGGG